MHNHNKETISKKTNVILMQQYNDLINQQEQSLQEKLSSMIGKKKSIFIIVSMLNGLDFHGYSTRAIYEAYYGICKLNDVQNIFPDVEFSRFVCKWFDYEIVDKKRGSKKYRVFKKVQDKSESSRFGSRFNLY